MKSKLMYFLAGVGFAGVLFTSEELSKEWQSIINNLIH
jgi:hypothetical protein